MTPERIALPKNLRARWSDTPRLAWVTARAFSTVQRPGRVGDVWAVPIAALTYLPITLAATLTGRAATNENRNALLLIYPDRRSRASLWLVAAVWLGVISVIAYVSIDLAVGGTTVTQLCVRLAAWSCMYVAIWVPYTVDALSLIRRGLHPDSVGLVRHVGRLRRAGKRCAAISAWSTWPPHRASGRQLADDLLRELPPDAWLVATARSPTVAGWLQDRGFRFAGQGLLMERPATLDSSAQTTLSTAPGP